MKKLLVVVLALMLQSLPGASQELPASNGPLALRLRNVPLDFKAVPLTQVLSRLAASVNDGFLFFGAEVVVHKGEEPLVTAHIPAGSTVREAMAGLSKSLPDYEFVAAAPNLVNILPRHSEDDREDLLNLTVPSVDLIDVAPTNFLANPARFIPALKLALEGERQRGCTIGPGLSDKAPGVTEHLPAATVRQDLNLVAEAAIDSAVKGAGFASGWLYIREVSPSKANPPQAWRATDVLSAKQMAGRIRRPLSEEVRVPGAYHE